MLTPILAHEWAHLQHRDLHTLAATRLLLILLWPQLPYWLLRRTIRLDQETLADAAAADRAGRLNYAQQLLAWASSASHQRPPRLAGAVGLWEGPSQLKRRIALLLNEQFAVMRSCSTTWRRLCIASLAFAALALSLVTLQPSPVAGSDAPTSTPTRAAPEPAPQPADDNAGPAEPNVYAGVCVDEQDRPLTRVNVSLFMHGLIFFENGAPESIEPVAVATTDDAGKFRFENIAELAKDRALDGTSKQVTIVAQAKGRASAGKHEMLYFVTKRGKTSLLRMPPAATMSGRITDVAGEPLSDALVASGSGSYYIPHQGLNTRTDAEGRYRLDSLPSDIPGALAVRHPDHVSTYVTFPSLPTELNVKLRRGSVIKGRVVYQSLDPNLPPSPAAGVRVWAAGVRPPDDGVQREEIDNEADGKPRAVTDADGRYELRGLASLKYDVNCWSLDHVTAGHQDIEIGQQDDPREPRRTVEVPDMVLTDGAIVRIKLIDAGSSNPLPVKEGTQAFITPRRTSRADAGYSIQLSAKVNEKSEAEIRVPAGRYTLSALIRAVADDPAWTSASDKITTASGEADFIEIKEGETVEVTIPMQSHFPSDVNDLDSPPLAVEVQTPSYAPQWAGTPMPPTPPLAAPAASPAGVPVPLEANPLGERDIPIEGGADDSSPNHKADPPSASSKSEAFTISGRCIDEVGKPVPNTRLWLPLRPEFLDYAATLETVADDAGKFAFKIPADLPGPSAALQLSTIYAYEAAHAVGIASAYKQLKFGELSAVEVTLPDSAATTYRILAPAGDPVADAKVEPWHIPAGGIYPAALQRLLEETSDAHGIVKLRGMRESDIRSVRVHHAVWGEQEFSELNNRRLASNNDLHLKFVGGIVGRVQTNGDDPVAGIPVYASTESELSRSDGAPKGNANTVTDAEGRFKMSAIASGTGQISFYVDRALPWRVRPGGRFTVRVDEITELNVPLERAVRAKGVVRTADTRAPVPHAQVHLRHGDLTGNWMTEQTITDAEGRFEAFVLRGEIRMYIQQKPAEFDPYECTEERRKTPIIVSDDSDTFDLPPIELERTKAVEGIVVDHNDQPLSKVQLYVTESNYTYGNTTSDEKGRFVMQVPPSVTIEEYVIRTNDSRDRHVLEVVSESPLKLRTPAPSVRQDAKAPSEANESEQATGNQGASTESKSLTPFWTIPTATDLKLTVIGVPATEADSAANDTSAPESEIWRLLPEPALKVSNPATLQEAVN